MTQRMALWLVPMLLTLHDAEEALFAPGYLSRADFPFPGPLGALIAPLAPQGFVGALLVVTMIPYIAALNGNLERPRSSAVLFLLAVQGAVLANVAWHAAAAVTLGDYTPGLFTALAVNLPFSMYLLHRAARERWLRRRELAGFVVLGVALHAVLLLVWIALD